MTATHPFRVLVVDDTPSIHDDFRKVLANPGEETRSMRQLAAAIFGRETPALVLPRFELDFALQGREALALVQQSAATQRPFAVAFVDMRMPPGWDGLETITHLWAVDPDIQVVICTAYSDHSWGTITQRLGPTDKLLILKKPFDHAEALQLAHALSIKWQVTRENRAHVASLDRTVHERTHQLESAEHRFTEAFNASPLPEVIIAHEPQFEILAINEAFRRDLGISLEDIAQATPETFGRGLDPVRWRSILSRIVAGEKIDDYPFVFVPQRGVERHLRCSARAMSIDGRLCSIWLLRDVTHQIETEQQLRQSQKLEAIGQLSAGIAHDFNNLLTVIRGYTSEVLATQPNSEIRRMLEPVQTAADRAAALTRQLLVFSRKQVTQPELVQLDAILAELRPLVRRLIGADIDLQWAIETDLPSVLADPASLEQIIVNLLVNARDAMPNGGVITVTARRRHVDADTAARYIDARPGDYIEISVTDSGSGIPHEVLPHIFEPFFTTKEAGKGTGLGLSTVYSIVHQHGGWITVQSQLGQGTTFTFYHPIPPSSPAPTEPAPAQRPAPDTPCDSFRRVLVAEDDPVVQSLLSAVFARRGIPCDIAPDGPSAFALWRQRGADYDLLLTDMVMPNGMSGLRLLSDIRAERTTLPVILMSGYSAALFEPNALGSVPGGPPRLLLKPFLPNDLIHAMNDLVPGV